METKVIVGSKNPVKIRCTQIAFDKVFPNDQVIVEGVSVPSGVSDQPMSDNETHQGALNRTQRAMKDYPDADYWVGIEGGITDSETCMEAFAWVTVLSKKQSGQARTATFQLPPKVRELVRQGIELGVADDMVFQRSNSKQTNGAVGILTNDLIDRTGYYEPAVVLALVPFLHPELY